MASWVVLWIMPPVHGSAVVAQAPPVPVTFNPPLVPVVLRRMPLVAPLDEIESKFRLPAVMPRRVDVERRTRARRDRVARAAHGERAVGRGEALPLVVSMSSPPPVNETR